MRGCVHALACVSEYLEHAHAYAYTLRSCLNVRVLGHCHFVFEYHSLLQIDTFLLAFDGASSNHLESLGRQTIYIYILT